MVAMVISASISENQNLMSEVENSTLIWRPNSDALAPSAAFSVSNSAMSVAASAASAALIGGLNGGAFTGNLTCTGLKWSLGSASWSLSAPKVRLSSSPTLETAASLDNRLRMPDMSSSTS